MNPWTALLVGILLGWLIEYAVDWFYWRRQPTDEQIVADLQDQLKASEERSAELETQLAALGVGSAAGAVVTSDRDKEVMSDEDIISEEFADPDLDDDLVILEEQDVEIDSSLPLEDTDETSGEVRAVNEDEILAAYTESSAEAPIAEGTYEAHSYFDPEEYETGIEDSDDTSGADMMDSAPEVGPAEQVTDLPDANALDSAEGGEES